MTDRNNSDSELSRRFADLRDADASVTPSVEGIIRGRVRARRKAVYRRPALLAAGAIVTAVFATVVIVNWQARLHAPDDTIIEWHPRSDALLMGARQLMMIDMPPLSASVLDPILP